MQLRNDGLTISFGTDDAPARDGLVITVRPRNLSNVVQVHYRVNGNRPNTLRAQEITPPPSADSQSFRVSFPRLPDGALVEYLPVCQSAGRQVPPPTLRDFPASFRVPESPPTTVADAPAETKPLREKHPFATEYLMTVSAFVRKPEVVVKTPEGLRVCWFLQSGTFQGPRLRGTVREAIDLMVVRRDGVGIMDVHAVLETHDGALISAEYSGVFELGEGGYENFLAGKYPRAPEARAAPRYVTVDSRYSWLNRLQCVLAGAVDMDTLNFVYDAYAFH